MRIVSWNINGLRGAQAALRSLLGSSDIDVLCLQEIKCSNVVAVDILRDMGFAHVAVCAAAKAGYSGVAIASRAAPFRAFTPSGTGVPEAAGGEGRVIGGEFDGVVVVSCYVPNSKRDLSRLAFRCESWEPWMRQYVKGLMAGGKPVVFAGDLNVVPTATVLDIHNPDAKGAAALRRAGFTVEERTAFGEFLQETGLQDAFRALHPRMVRYSWWSPFAGSRAKNKGWRIDLVLTDPRLPLVSADVLSDVMGSDHAPVEVVI